MAVQINTIGMTVVHEPQVTGNDNLSGTNGDASAEFDIVLVHGLFGNPKKTWTANRARAVHTSKHDGYPATDDASDCEERPAKKKRTGERELFEEARILTWGYDVQIERLFSPVSNVSILSHAETLLSDLSFLRQTPSEKARNIYFIAHSLGGIVVKDALNLSRNEVTFLRDILPATHGIVFLGTPHHGSKVASLGKKVFEITKIFGQKPNTQVLRGLENNSEISERVSRSFGQILATDQFKVHSFIEELDTKGVRIIEPASSSIGYFKETRSTLHANHRSMAKFSSLDNQNFKRLVSILQQWISEGQNPKTNLGDQLGQGPGHIVPDGLIFDEQYRTCLRSLNFAEARKRVRDVDAPFRKTQEWLFDESIGFGRWLAGETSDTIFWIQGKPGSGKSTLMKNALSHSKTAEILSSTKRDPWIVAAYFFHDRGESSQKSVEGFLREILYQILLRQKRLFALVYPLIAQSDSNLFNVSLPEGYRDNGHTVSWTTSSIQEVLMSIITNSTYEINMCLFVDALDEHDGNHRDLLAILEGLRQWAGDSSSQLRLCLASRPENAFKDAFQVCPGLIIHEHTTEDIMLYAKGRLQNETRSDLTDDGHRNLELLLQDIITKAQGVFLWVRLVLDELIEGLSDGDSIEELRRIVSAIPTELEDLYIRALRRKRRTHSLTTQNHKPEAYVMFQIAISCVRPLPLDHFLSAAHFACTGKRMDVEDRMLSIDQLERRLYSRAAGLLEAVGDDREVQFIHQTVKEFMVSNSGSEVISQGIPEQQESGTQLIFRYVVDVMINIDESPIIGPRTLKLSDAKFVEGNFRKYARTLDIELGAWPGRHLSTQILRFSEPVQRDVLDNIDRNGILYAGEGRPLASPQSPLVRILSLLIARDMRQSFQELVKPCIDDLTSVDIFVLFMTAFDLLTVSTPVRSLGGPHPYCHQTLLDLGLGDLLSSTTLRSLSSRKRKSRKNLNYLIFCMEDETREIHLERFWLPWDNYLESRNLDPSVSTSGSQSE